MNLDATYYKENTRDQIMNISTPSISGVSNQLINAGNIQNSGVEIALIRFLSVIKIGSGT
nr:TonB-dependent receptor [Phocaeicola vulgatus]